MTNPLHIPAEPRADGAQTGTTPTGAVHGKRPFARGVRAQRSQRAQRGMTLVEITISIAIIAVLLAATVFALDAVTGASAKKATGQLASTIRGLYDEAALTGRTCRMTFELPDERSPDAQVKWHAECAEQGVTMAKDRDAELDKANDAEKEKRRSTGEQAAQDAVEHREQRDYNLLATPTLDEVMSREEKRADAEVKFSDYKPPTQDPMEIPPGVKVSVWTKGQKEPVKSGVAYLYFHPQGYTERAQIYVEQGENVWTIKISPLTGKTEVVASREEIPR